MSAYDGEGTDFAEADLAGPSETGAWNGKPGETQMAQQEAIGVGAGRALSNIERQDLGWGDVEGFNLNNPTQSVNEMRNSENVGNFLGGLVGYNPRADTTGFNGILNSSFGNLARTFLSLNPIGAMANMGINLWQNRNDPFKAALGLVPGWGGSIAHTAYGAIQSPNPMAFLGNQALTQGAGMVGGRFGGALGAKAAGNIAGMFTGPGGPQMPSFGGPSMPSVSMPSAPSAQTALQDFSRPGEGNPDQWTQMLQRNFGGPA